MAALLRSKLMASAPCPSTPSSAWVMATVAMSVTTSMTRFLGSGHALRTPWHGFKKAHATRNFGNSWYLAGFAPSTAALDEVFMICLPSFHVLFSRVFSENLEDQKSLLGTTGCLPPFKRFMYRSFWNMLLVLFPRALYQFQRHPSIVITFMWLSTLIYLTFTQNWNTS